MSRSPSTVTSPYAPDLKEVRAWLEKMVAATRFVELIMAVLALITRVRAGVECASTQCRGCHSGG